MPKITLSSKVNQQPDSIFLQSWIEDFIKNDQLTISKITNIDDYGFNIDAYIQLILQKPSHLVKVNRFYIIDNYKVYGSIRDNKYQLLS